MAAEKYRPLKDFVEARCGTRGGFHRGIRNRLAEIAVEEFPTDAPAEKCLEVLNARMRVRIRQEYGSVVAMLIISVFANLIARAVWEWWKRNRTNKVVMAGWKEEAARAKEG